MLFNLYFVESHSQSESQRDHRALYIETDAKNKTGQIYHVRGFSVGNGMTYETKMVTPTESATFKRIFQIGTLDSETISRVNDICEAEVPPRTPLKKPKGVRRPDCVDWIDNVIYRLHHAGIAQFDRKVVPNQLKSLQIVDTPFSK